MRCLACGVVLKTHECTRRMVNSGDYPDLCDRCFSTISDDVASTEGHYDTQEFDNESEVIIDRGEYFGSSPEDAEEQD